ncbi:MAG: helix-turn-helix domain-containing protein [Frankiales bacterium]|nr:helix-turn-helix domain-containing protein [Frankiales bacterium]
MPKIAAVVPPGVTQFELGVVYEVFGVDRRYLTPDWYDFSFCAGGPGPIRTEAGLLLDTACGLDDLAKADTVIVLPSVHDDQPLDELEDALRAAYDNGARIASICTGAFILGRAGLLDDRRATTHWAHAALLAERYPQAEIDPNVLYVEDDRVFTSAGSAAGIDLCLHLVRLDLGTDIANAVARRMVVPPHRDGGQAQYVDSPLPPCEQETIGPLLDWALARLDEPLTLADLARQANVSVRTLVRRFAAATGTTPLQWVLAQRVRRAQHLLESSDEPVERIASLAGFGTAANLRQHFTRVVGVPPMQYRRTFSGSPASGVA